MKKYILLFLALTCSIIAQAGTYRTIANGNYLDASIWEYSNGSTWSSISQYPTPSPHETIIIQDDVTVSTDIFINGYIKLQVFFPGSLTFSNGGYIHSYPTSTLHLQSSTITINQTGSFLSFANNLPTTYSTGCFDGYDRDSISIVGNLNVEYNNIANIQLSELITDYHKIGLLNSTINSLGGNVTIDTMELDNSTISFNGAMVTGIRSLDHSVININTANNTISNLNLFGSSILNLSNQTNTCNQINLDHSTVNLNADIYFQTMKLNNNSNLNITSPCNLNQYEIIKVNSGSSLHVLAPTIFDANCNLSVTGASQITLDAPTTFANVPILKATNSNATPIMNIHESVTCSSTGFDDSLCTYTTSIDAELHLVSNVNSITIPKISSLKKLEISIGVGGYAFLQQDLIITGVLGLDLNTGDINTSSFKIILEDDTPMSFSGSSRVCGTMSIKVQTAMNSVETIYFPIGVNHVSAPIKIDLSTNGLPSCYLTASVKGAVPAGSANLITLGGSLGDKYYTLKVEQTNPNFNSNTITNIANIELKLNDISPSLTSISKIGFSYDNTLLSYEGISSSVSPPYITCTQLSAAQIADLGTVDGSFIGIAKNILAPGEYCVGPSLSYTAPAGSPAYQNGNEPFGNLSIALNALQTQGCNGHITFVLQNNYTGTAGAPNFTQENNPISIAYQGDVSRTLTITSRTDNTSPILIQNTKANGVGIIEFNGARYVYLRGSINNVCGDYGIKIQNNASYSLNFAPGYSNCISFKNDTRHVTVSGVQFEVADRGINFDNNAASQGSDSIMISCNKFMVRADLMNTNCYPFGIAFDHNGFANPTATSNDITIQYNKFENMNTSIYLYEGVSGAINITSNHFYRNTSNSPGPSFQQFIQSGKPINLLIDQNCFGGSATFCTGSKMNVGNAQYLLLLNASTPSSNVKSVLSNNRFENMMQSTGTNLYCARMDGSCVWDIVGNTFGNPSTVNDLSMNSTTSFYGVYAITSSNATTNNLVSQIHNNSFNNINCSAVNGAYFYGIQCGGPGVSIQNNSFKNITSNASYGFQMITSSNYTPLVGQINEFNYNTAENIVQTNTTSSNDDMGIFKIASGAGLPANLHCIGNRIGSLTTANDIVFHGSLIRPFYLNIWHNALRVDSNTICNMLLDKESTSPNVMLEIIAKSNASCAYNSVFNIHSKSKYNSPEASTPHASLTGMIINCSDGFLTTNSQVHHNTIDNLNNSNNTPLSYGISVAGIIIKGASQLIDSYSIYNNKVTGLINQGISSGANPYVFGIAYQADTKSLWYNNAIYLSNGGYTNAINNYCVRKFFNYYKGIKFYHNTLVLGGSSVPNGNGYCLYKDYNAAMDTMKNNLFRCLVYPSGSYYCVGTNALALNEWGFSDYNVFYNFYGNQMGYKPTSAVNFTGWKSFFLGTELHSQYRDFLLQDILAGDLHLNPATNCALDNAGIYIPSVATDMDGDIRSNPPDIGADEFTYTAPIVTASTLSPSICIGSPLDLTSNSSSPLLNLTYSWTGPNSFTASTQNPSILNAQTIHQGTYSVTVTDVYGCSGSGTVSVSVNPFQTWYFDQDGDSYYNGNSVSSCTSPGAYYTTNNLGMDCDDADANANPGATEICGNNIDDNCDGNIDEGCNTVNILAGKVFIQGYYSGAGEMNPVLNYQGESALTTITDSVTIELREVNSLSVIAYLGKTTLDVEGEFTLIGMPSNLLDETCYMVVKHRNSIETWSAYPISMASYSYFNFTTAANKAYGDNQIEVETGKWAIYSGDINQDGFIDSFDFPALDTDIFNGVSGVYVNTDLNGDCFVDSFDFPIFDTNSYNGVSIITP